MANTINDLYLKYVNRIGKTLEKDRYFQYLFEMVQAGSSTLQQTHQVLHKVVDERWLTTIEESLDAINTIIEKPRRFVTTTEEVVPVALARKITADSVRHLSMNTQYIASNEEGDIQPTRVLNVTTDESFDLYENRFIYHLIQRLVTFIDKRTDVIFWSTGDETRNVLRMENKVDDAYEEIEYKIEMTIRNRQSFAENDSENMQVFMRIDRVRRMVMALRNSSFCSLMAGCSKVRSPIQRTNLMIKDPNYRTCYKLWQFLERYDEVGYTIEARDSSLEFDEEYLIQMYTNLIMNYTVFKSLLEDDPRRLEEAPVKRRSVIKPKFIKKIEEQIVDDYDIPDVEVRKVIIEEVTQAQLDAEAKLEEETARRQEAEEACENARMQLENERWQAEIQIQALQQTAEMQMKEAEEKLQETRNQARAEMQELQDRTTAEMQELQDRANAEMQELQDQAHAEMQELQEQTETRISEVREQTRAEAQARVEEAEKQAEILVEEARKQAEALVEEARKQAEAQIESILQRAQKDILAVQEKAEKQVQEAQRAEEAAVMAQKEAEEAARAEKEAREEAERREEEAFKRAELEAKARAKAEAKADANRLTNRIIAAWTKRHEQGNDMKEKAEKETEEETEKETEEVEQ